MTARTRGLHQALLLALGGRVARHSDLARKPFLVDLTSPEALRLRIYAYSLVGGAGERARREYKVVLRVPGQAVGSYGSFDQTDGRFTTVIGYDASLDVFVLWDASLHPRFKNGGNLQVRDDVVRIAAAAGHAQTIRLLTGGAREAVFACQSSSLSATLRARIATTGGLMEGECLTSPT
ncbi:hypothetical protein [Sinorhizobium meliloti]|uniref:hypothetical protein n=1 Tax=Rhizobium meliloti TaxID=382 RepID=UPI003999F6B7